MLINISIIWYRICQNTNKRIKGLIKILNKILFLYQFSKRKLILIITIYHLKIYIIRKNLIKPLIIKKIFIVHLQISIKINLIAKKRNQIYSYLNLYKNLILKSNLVHLLKFLEEKKIDKI